MKWNDIKQEIKDIGEKVAKRAGRLLVTGVLIATIGEVTKKVAQWMGEDARRSEEEDREVLSEQSEEE